MTIAATAITIDGPTAWLVGPDYTPAFIATLNRPCDTCCGTGAHILDELEDDRSFWKTEDCPACQGTGQHTFTLDVEGECMSIANGRLRRYDGFAIAVHVVEVLPIHDHCADYKPADHICRAWQDERWYWHRSDLGDRPTEEIVTLSADAAPGMSAVRMAVHI